MTLILTLTLTLALTLAQVEQRFWDDAHDAWRRSQREAHGEAAAPVDVSAAVLLHYVGRDKPWMRYERSRRPDDERELCRKLRNADAQTCSRYLAIQALWWRAFAASRCLVVGLSRSEPLPQFDGHGLADTTRPATGECASLHATEHDA